MADAAARLAARDDRRCRPTTPSAARTSAPGSPRWPSCPTCGSRPSTSCSTLAPVPDPGFGSLLWQAVLGAWPASADPDLRTACTATPRRRCARPATAPRGPSRTRTTRPPCTPRSTPPSTTPPYAASLDGPARRTSRARLEQRARGQAARDHRCPACRTSTRAASCGSRAWSTPTTGAPWTSTSRDAACSAGELPRAPTTTDGPSCSSPATALTAAPRPARAVHGVHAVAAERSGRRPRAGLRPRRRDHRRDPAAGRPGCARRLGRHRSSTCPPGSWRDVLTGRPADGPLLADLLAVHPVALLVKEN